MTTSRPGVSDPEQPNHPIEPDVPYQPTEPDEPDVQEPITAQGVERSAQSGSRLKTEYSNGGNETLEKNSMHLKVKPEEKTPDAPQSITGKDEQPDGINSGKHGDGDIEKGNGIDSITSDVAGNFAKKPGMKEVVGNKPTYH